MQRTHTQELQRAEESKLLDQLVADLPSVQSMQDLIEEVKSKFGDCCLDKVYLCD
jgi:hypothetical protein